MIVDILELPKYIFLIFFLRFFACISLQGSPASLIIKDYGYSL